MNKAIMGAIVADTVYCNDKLVGEHVEFELPGVGLKMATLPVNGDLERPITGQTEALVTSITSIGADYGLAEIVRGGNQNLEIRYVVDRTGPDGTTKPVGCKAFVKGIAKGIPSITGKPGETMDADVEIATDRYQLYVDGEEMWLVDKINGIYRVAGKDYMADIRDML